MDRYVTEHFGLSHQEAELRDPGMTTLVVEVEGRAAGYVQLARRAPPPVVTGSAPLEVLRFYVDRPWHGQGVAQTLMAATLEAARAAGARTLWLGVWGQNPRAIAFYRKSGFEEVGTQTFVLGTDRQSDFVFARPVD
jgi:GNAT superfamily N-acetyltransferase